MPATGTFRKSSFSDPSGDSVEVLFQNDETDFKGSIPVEVYVSDSFDRSHRTLGFTRPEWQAFVNGVKAGEFDLP